MSAVYLLLTRHQAYSNCAFCVMKDERTCSLYTFSNFYNRMQQVHFARWRNARAIFFLFSPLFFFFFFFFLFFFLFFSFFFFFDTQYMLPFLIRHFFADFAISLRVARCAWRQINCNLIPGTGMKNIKVKHWYLIAAGYVSAKKHAGNSAVSAQNLDPPAFCHRFLIGGASRNDAGRQIISKISRR